MNCLANQENFYSVCLDALKQKKKAGYKIFGYLCPKIPKELLLAADILPIRLGIPQKSEQHYATEIQEYSCLNARAVLDTFLKGDVSFLDGLIPCISCDTMKCISEIMARQLPDKFVFPFYLPKNLDTGDCFDFLVAQYADLKAQLERYLNRKISDSKLESGLNMLRAISENLQTLYQEREKDRTLASGDFYQLLELAHLMDPSDFLTGFPQRLAVWKTKKISGRPKPLFLICTTPPGPEFIEMVEQSGGVILGDSSCLGTRDAISLSEDRPGDLIPRAVRAFLSKPSCPIQHSSQTGFVQSLIQEIQRVSPVGCLFVPPQYCEPMAFVFPKIRDLLKEMKIRITEIELSPDQAGTAQQKTRLAAFIEGL